MPHTFDRITSDETLPTRADVVVVGAGVIGVAAALFVGGKGGDDVAVRDEAFLFHADQCGINVLNGGRLFIGAKFYISGNNNPAYSLGRSCFLNVVSGKLEGLQVLYGRHRIGR